MKKLLLLLFVLPILCFGQIPDSKPNTFVNDYYGVLTDAQIKELNDSILAIENKSPTQIAILLLKEIPNGVDASEYANNVGRQWKVGKDKSGIVYVAGIDQHKQGIGTALNIEASITDYECSRIMDEMKPYFRNKDYYGGLKHMVAEINLLIDPTAAPKTSDSSIWIFIAIVLGITCVPVYLLIRSKMRKKKEEDQYIPSIRNYGYGTNLASFGAGYVAGSSSRSSDSDSGYSSPSSYSGSSDSGSSNSSSYGDYSSGSSGSDSGFSGGGASSDW